MRLLKDALTAKTVADDLIGRADQLAKQVKAHPDWRDEDELNKGTIDYTCNKFENINFNLRNDVALSALDQGIYEDLMADMRPLSSPFTAYRLVDMEVGYKEGQTFTAKSFWSTTLDLNRIRISFNSVCIKFLIIPRGIDAVMVQGRHQESELILPPGTKFVVRHKVTNYRDKVKGITIKEVYVIYARN